MTEFVYPHTTPELQAYLTHQAGYTALANSTYPAYQAAEKPWADAGRPATGPLKDEERRLSEIHYGGLKRHQKEGEELALKVQPGLMKAYRKAQMVWMCRDETSDPKRTREEFDPSGKYKLVVSSHTTGKGTWAYSKGKVFNVETGALIAEVHRNYSGFNSCWIHRSDGDFLLTGEDYQGFTIIRLETGERVDYLPDAAKRGFGWCWVKGTPSPDGQMIALEGCFWAFPYEVVIFDFARPMELPWIELHRSEYDDFHGWTDNTSCSIGVEREVVNVPGHRLHGKIQNDMTDDELREIEALANEKDVSEDALYEQKKISSESWVRPPAIDIARKYILDNVGHRKNRYPYVDSDLRTAVQNQILALDSDDRTKLKAEPAIAELLAWMETAPFEE